ncbi:serine racemase VanT catalytic subunit [Paenibacillus spongiae]|uniref:Alanine racemase n=1 Tax=Paenibacillus spongiae TaxID=2909671 RepID=A0ABY5S9Q1_9BACL|nr:serine racemase VanT catalytic subunit [Paenibacillus spongiae]UVI30667.1 serine racemase VanT catalytic subunit [Paenibacillus spongiae]
MNTLPPAALLLRPKPASEASSVRRAWAEINLDHLDHNLLALKTALPSRCDIMPVVKANAYGHGSIQVAQYLNRIGVNQFAVAEIEEGIELRKHGVKGDILILSYTPLGRAYDLFRYRLTQAIVSAEYGQALNQCGLKLKAHVKIDTGMNRLGEPYENIQAIISCYRLEHLHVMGTFSHLSVSDSTRSEQAAFTNMQVERFLHVIRQIEAAGCSPGAVHIQSSYGILNYPAIDCDLARPGIALYGLLSREDDAVMAPIELRPVLSLKAAVAQVKEVRANSPIGYGHKFIPSQDIRIATLTIGYGDGIPKTLADNGGYVLIRGQRAGIIGNICMDQFMVDVTAIHGIRHGDTATLIGQDGSETITAGQIASRCGTVTNEIVSRIGSRVERVYTSTSNEQVETSV